MVGCDFPGCGTLDKCLYHPIVGAESDSTVYSADLCATLCQNPLASCCATICVGWKRLSLTDLFFLKPLCSGGIRLVLSAHEYKRVVTMDSSTFPRLQRRNMGRKLPKFDFFLFGVLGWTLSSIGFVIVPVSVFT